MHLLESTTQSLIKPIIWYIMKSENEGREIKMQRLGLLIRKYLVKFGMVGVLNTIIQQLLYLILIFATVPLLVSQTISFLIAFLCSYVLNSKFTYRVPLSFKQLISFLMANLPSYFIQLFVLIVIVEGLHVPKSIALFFTLFITIPITFILVSFSMVKSNQS